MLNTELANREYLCESFSVADIAYFLTVSFAVQLGTPPHGDYPNLAGWLMRMTARPCIAREMEAMTAAAASLT